MSSDEMSPRQEPRKFDAYFELPRAYTLVYEWGHFAVSKAADAAYGISPYEEGAIKGDQELPILPPKSVELILLGPSEGEVIDTPLLPPPTQESTSAQLSVISELTDQKTLRIAMAYDKSADQALEAEMLRHATKLGITVDEMQARYTLENGVPLQEYLTNELPQKYVHGMTSSELISLIARWGPAREPTRIKRFLKKFSLGPLTEANIIVNDIHNSFCSHVFETKFRRSLTDPNEQ